MTASLRASATFALRGPVLLASASAQSRSPDPPMLRVVAHARQKLALGLGRLHRLVTGRRHFRLPLLELGNVGVDADGAAVLGLAR
jgi:hypothetical protein